MEISMNPERNDDEKLKRRWYAMPEMMDFVARTSRFLIKKEKQDSEAATMNATASESRFDLDDWQKFKTASVEHICASLVPLKPVRRLKPPALSTFFMHPYVSLSSSAKSSLYS